MKEGEASIAIFLENEDEATHREDWNWKTATRVAERQNSGQRD